MEGKIGQVKRRFGLGRIMAKLACTSAAQISLSFLVANLERALRWLLFSWLWLRHEVAPNRARAERVSVSFNYGWR